MNRITAAFFVCASALVLASQIETAQAATESVVYSFRGKSGDNPSAGLINVSGTLYGTTANGGTGSCDQGCGTVFSIDPARGSESVVYSFQNDGIDGSHPLAGLTNIKNTLFGTTGSGGNTRCNGGGCGTIFSVDLTTGSETVVHRFLHDGLDGYTPYAGLIDVSGVLYGTTAHGGSSGNSCRHGCGTVYSFDPITGVETILHAFQYNGSDGYIPCAGLIGIKGTLYGTTQDGVTKNHFAGTVFALNPATGGESVLHSFSSKATDGHYPVAGLIDANRRLYGTTGFGGTYGLGTVFVLNRETGTEKVVHSFQSNGTDGAVPQAGVIKVNGILYGTTEAGGTYGYGTVFSVDPKTGVETVLHSFQNNGKDGVYPFAGLVDADGTLYGTTAEGGTGPCQGGANGCGTVFKVQP